MLDDSVIWLSMAKSRRLVFLQFMLHRHDHFGIAGSPDPVGVLVRFVHPTAQNRTVPGVVISIVAVLV